MAEESITFSFLGGLPLAISALQYARESHRGQRRASDDAPFILHPLEVASLLHNTGHAEHVVAAGILHDTIENSTANQPELAERFGHGVAGLVASLTEDPTIEDFDRRKATLREMIAAYGSDAIAVDAADKVAKVRELRAQAGRDPASLRDTETAAIPRLAHYVASLEMLEAAQPEHPLVRQLRFELEALRALPPRRAQLAAAATPTLPPKPPGSGDVA